MKLSIIIPVFNEQETVKDCLLKVKKSKVSGVKKEIIVVDDGSTDKTGFILKKIKGIKVLGYKKNKGKGYAIRQGLKKAAGKYVLIQDADLEYDPKDYKALLEPVLEGKVKVVYGSRFLGPRTNLLFWHMVGNRFLSFITNVLYNSTLSDMEVGYKVFPKDLLLSLNLKENCFGFEPEVTAKILKSGIRIFEVPISYYGRGYEEGKKITWKDGLKALAVLFKYKFID
jgi:glycosyltransferase involved in cell wall biosynthesis